MIGILLNVCLTDDVAGGENEAVCEDFGLVRAFFEGVFVSMESDREDARSFAHGVFNEEVKRNRKFSKNLEKCV